MALPVYLWHVKHGPAAADVLAVRATHLHVDSDRDMWLLDGNDNDETLAFIPRDQPLWIKRIAKVTNGDD